MADEDEIQRKRDRLAAETSDYFWHTCPELTARWRQAMLTLPPSVLRDLAVEIQHLEAVHQRGEPTAQCRGSPRSGWGGEPVEGLLDRALASMENLREAAEMMTRLLDELLKG
jgi:hypothetical protein